MTLAEIKNLLGDDKLVIGTDRSMKNLRQGNVQKVFLSSNCNAETVEDFEHYANMSEVEVEHLEAPNDELGVVCKKPFSISVISILK